MPVNMKRVIAAGFAKLMEQKPIDKITVKDVVEKCGISRQTFYYHFQDIRDVMEYCIRSHLSKARAKSLEESDPVKAAQEFVSAACDNGQMLKALMNSQKRRQVEKMFMDAMMNCVEQRIHTSKPNTRLSSTEMELAKQFYASGLAGVILANCTNTELDIRQAAGFLFRLIEGGEVF